MSYYVDTWNLATWYNAGCTLGAADLARPGVQERYVILDFGNPAMSGGLYGTTPPGTGASGGQFHSRADLRYIPTEFAGGYSDCVGGDSSHISLALGESNYGSQVASNYYQQGRAWGNFVAQAISDNASYAPHVGITGAFDTELLFNSATTSLGLLNAYSGLYGYASTDFGDASGCPPPTGHVCDNSWSYAQIYQKSGQAPYRVAMPEDYNQAGTVASEWQLISNFAAVTYGTKINFAGTLAQYQACADRHSTCPGTDNTPDQAWTLLYNALQTSGTTAMTPRFSGDIRWGSSL